MTVTLALPAPESLPLPGPLTESEIVPDPVAEICRVAAVGQEIVEVRLTGCAATGVVVGGVVGGGGGGCWVVCCGVVGVGAACCWVVCCCGVVGSGWFCCVVDSLVGGAAVATVMTVTTGGGSGLLVGLAVVLGVGFAVTRGVGFVDDFGVALEGVGFTEVRAGDVVRTTRVVASSDVGAGLVTVTATVTRGARDGGAVGSAVTRPTTCRPSGTNATRIMTAATTLTTGCQAQ